MHPYNILSIVLYLSYNTKPSSLVFNFIRYNNISFLYGK